MKIAYIVETFTEGLGYIDNILPFELADRGNEVHLVTCRLPAYYQRDEAFFGGLLNNVPTVEREVLRGVQIHTCRYRRVGSRIMMSGLLGKLREISPDVVIVRGLSSPVLGQVIFCKAFVKFSLFTSTGQAYSAMPKELAKGVKLSRRWIFHALTRILPGRMFSYFSKACIASTEDCALCAVDFYGIPKNKLEVVPLGVDTTIFHPVLDHDSRHRRGLLRNELGIREGDCVCIWTGRMTRAKSIMTLAHAISELNDEGYAFVGLFVGAGPESESLRGMKDCIVHDFVAWRELADFYRASDMAVWPKSITTSTLDASACGLPVIMSDQEAATERWDGIGASYEEGNVQSLKNVLIRYLDLAKRQKDGLAGASRMRDEYSWKIISGRFQSFLEAK